MDLPTMTTNVRNDINDLGVGSLQRLSDTIIQREIDRANDRYSFIAPLLKTSQVSSYVAGRIYASPSGCWWVEQVEYPINQWPKMFVPFAERLSPLINAPSWGSPSSSYFNTAMTAAISGSGSLGSGTYQYAATFVVPGAGETTASPIVSIATGGAGVGVLLSNVPIGPYGTSARNLYRTTVGGSQLKLLAGINDNTTATYLDQLADGSLGANVPVTNTTQSIPQFELQVQPSQLPADGTGFLEVMAAYKHQLDNSGTTIPEKHWDAIALGAEAFSLYSYLALTNDNFDYVDGQFRDRVDDTKAPIAWKAHADHFLTLFQDRLKHIQNERQALSRPMPQWGDKAVRWDRL